MNEEPLLTMFVFEFEFEFAFEIEFEMELEFQGPNYQLRERDQTINFGKETKPSALGNRLTHQLWESD